MKCCIFCALFENLAAEKDIRLIDDFVYQGVTLVIGFTAVFAGIGVVLCASPIYSALYLIGNMVCLAMLYLLYNAEFIAAVQMIVYAGAVMILFIFIIALLGGKKELKEPSPERSIAFTFITLLFGELLMALTVGDAKPLSEQTVAPQELGSAKAVGLHLYSNHLIAFELASVLLLAATVGIICLAKFPLRPVKRRIE